MAKCKKCSKKGFFLRVNSEGLCNDCQRSSVLEQEENRIKQSIERLSNEITEKEKILAEKDSLYQSICKKAEEDALQNIEQRIEGKNSELNVLSERINSTQQDLENLKADLEKSEKNLATNTKKLQKMLTLYKSMKYSVENFLDRNLITGDDLRSEVEDILSPTVQLKLHNMDVKQLRKLFNQNEKIIQDTFEKYKVRYTTKTNMSIYKLMVIALEAELQNVLYNINYGKLDKAIENIKAITAKYLQISTDGNQNIAPTMMKFIGEIEYLFIEAVKIEYEYYVQKERIKEEQRALREQMRQEAEEHRQLEQQRKQVEKEEEKYKNEIASITQQISQSADDNKIIQLQERIAQLQVQLTAVEEKKEQILNRQNGQAGYVYLISNLGAFGDNVFKIGMTRRLEPQDRINELGDASVPFPFDVHSFIFSDDAVGLESRIHKMLNSNRLNKINLRKEFFTISIDELEQLVYSLEPSAEFNRTLLAEQYHQSLSITEMPENVELLTDENDDIADED
jgi:predicted RNase H-like nuclease (RuvC/YqgF family)